MIPTVTSRIMRNSSLFPSNDWLENTTQVFGFPSSWFLVIGLILVFATLLASAVAVVTVLTFVVKRVCRKQKHFENSQIWTPRIFSVKQSELKTSLLTSELPTYDQCLDIKDGQSYWWDEGNFESGLFGSSSPPSFSTLDELQMTCK